MPGFFKQLAHRHTKGFRYHGDGGRFNVLVLALCSRHCHPVQAGAVCQLG